MTLLSFTGLLTAFVLYRAGVLENVFQSSPNGGKMPGIAALSPQSDSAKAMQIMPSSKSIGVFQNTSTGGNSSQSDSAKRVNDSLARKIKDSLDSYHERERLFLSSSKSGAIVNSININTVSNNEAIGFENTQDLIEKLASSKYFKSFLKHWEDSTKLKELPIIFSSKSGHAADIQDIKLLKDIIDNMMKTDSSKSGHAANILDLKLWKGTIDSIMKTDSSKIKSKKTPATKTPKK